MNVVPRTLPPAVANGPETLERKDGSSVKIVPLGGRRYDLLDLAHGWTVRQQRFPNASLDKLRAKAREWAGQPVGGYR